MSDKELFLTQEEESVLNDALQKRLTEYQIKEVSLQNLMHLIKLRNKLGKNINFEREAEKRLKKLVGEFTDENVKQLLVQKDAEIREKSEKDLDALQVAFQLFTLSKSVSEKTIDSRIKFELQQVKEMLEVDCEK